MRWAIGTPFLDSTHWLAIVGMMRYNTEITFHFGIFWVMVSWE